MKKSDGDRVRLLHILEAIQYIHAFTLGKTKTDIYNDPMFRFAIERQLEIIGEAANHLSNDLKITHPEIEWRKIVAFRNFVAHEYFGIDLELVWDIVVNKIPPLHQTILELLADR
jgi:uncharacterized protein with HEPN domain